MMNPDDSGTLVMPMVSIVTATYNAETTLRACLESVRAQDYTNLEHVVIDGASKDGTVALLEEAAGDRLRWISERDKGIYDAWNKGVAMARGDWVAFLGADDVLLPGAVAAFVALARQHPEALYLSGRVRWLGPWGMPQMIGRPWSWRQFQRYMCVAHVGSMHHRKLFEQYGTFDTSYRMTADYEFLLRPRGLLKAAFLPQAVAEMHSGGATDSTKALREAARAKGTTGGRSTLLVALDDVRARVTFYARRAQHFLARDTAGKVTE